jgi:hypothetical protein
VRVADLSRGDLGLRWLGGSQASLERPVTGTTTVDLREPGRYVAVGHLVLTGLAWRRDAADSPAFVASVEAAGASALAVGEGLLGEVPPDVVEAAEAVGLPLFAVPPQTAFHRVSSFVDAAVGPRDDTVQRLLASLATGRSLAAVLAELPGVRVLSATGRLLAGDGLTEDEVDALFAAGPPGRPVGEGPTPWWLVADGVPEANLGALAGVLALYRRLPVAAEPPSGTVVGVVGDELALVVDAVADGPHVVVDGGVLAADVELLERRLRRTGVLAGGHLVVGVSRPVEDPEEALAGARRALRSARGREGRVVVEHDTETGGVADLLRSVPPEDRRRFAERVLAGVLQDADLLLTLRTLLRAGRSPTRTAALLHVHQNTVRYRLSRVESLLDRDLRDVDDVVDLQVALRLLDDSGD